MRNEYIDYEDLSPDCFERLVVLICKKILGIGTKGFAKGRDGGKDAKFTGKAECFPSKSSPWEGKVIIQAKHSSGYSESFSDKDFFSEKNQNCVICKECPKIKKLRDNSELDYYMLFSNRKLSADAERKICQFISKKCNLSENSIALFGREELEFYIKQYSDILQVADIQPNDSPLIVSPDELAEIVEHMSLSKEFLYEEIFPVDRTFFSKKNELNNLTEDYGNHILKLLKHFPCISDFLSNPENKEYVEKYESVILEFQSKILAFQNSFDSFDRAIEYILDLLVRRDPVLRNNKKLTRLFVYYMYWNCDIGKTC